jgi:hypothetical protein
MQTISRKPVTGRNEQHDRKLRKRSFGKAEMDGDERLIGHQHEVDKSKQEESEESEGRGRRRRREQEKAEYQNTRT